MSTTCWGPQTQQTGAVGFVPSWSAVGGTRGSVRVCSPPGPFHPVKQTRKEGRGRGVCRGSRGSRLGHVRVDGGRAVGRLPVCLRLPGVGIFSPTFC